MPSMRKVIRQFAAGLGVLLAVAIAALAVFLFKPWEKYPPFNWYRAALPGERVYMFTHWETLFPYDRIAASTKPRRFVRKLRPLEQVSYVFDGKTHTVGDYLERANVDGMLAIADGKVVFEVYRNGLGPETHHTLWSATKSFTGTLVGIALKEGAIHSIDDRVDRYAPQFKGTAYGEASVRSLLMMSSGVQFFHGLGRPNRDDMYFDMFIRHHNLDTFAASLARRVPPLTDWNYLATDTHVLSAVLRGAYHEGVAQILHDKLWQPAGFGSYATWSKHVDGPQGIVFGHCCLQLRLNDFALLGQLYEENLVVSGHSLVPDGWADMATRPNAPFQEPGDKPRGYAMQFWVPKDYDKEAMALGAFGQILWIDRKHHVVVAQFAANGNHPPSEAEENVVFRAIVYAVAKR